jgi:digeranylgeranylglycerophospholipid reductase
MESGHQAALTIIASLEKGEATEESLWSYAYDMMQSFGKEMANLEVLRRCLISMDDRSLNYGMKNKLVSERDINRASEGEKFNVNILSNIFRVFKGIRHPMLVNKLHLTSKYMVQLLNHYESYPRSPVGFERCQIKTTSLIDKVRGSIQG